MAQRRDEAFDAFFFGLLPQAYSLAFRVLGDVAAAEDVAAEALTRAYVHWRQVRDLVYRDAWVLRVAANLAIDRSRRRPPPLPAEPSVDVQEIATLRAALASALRALPRRQREAIALRYLVGLSEAEVAQALDVSVGAVKSHLHRGLTKLRRDLGEQSMLEVDLAHK